MDTLLHDTSLFNLIGFDRVDRVPARVQHLLIREPVKDPITAKYDKVMEVTPYSKLTYLRLCDNHTFFTTVFRILCLYVSKCP